MLDFIFFVTSIGSISFWLVSRWKIAFSASLELVTLRTLKHSSRICESVVKRNTLPRPLATNLHNSSWSVAYQRKNEPFHSREAYHEMTTSVNDFIEEMETYFWVWVFHSLLLLLSISWFSQLTFHSIRTSREWIISRIEWLVILKSFRNIGL